MKMQDVLPVVVSVLVIILVAVLQKQSKLVAAITATMPIGATLSLWIISSANQGDSAVMGEFSQGLVMGVLSSLCFVIAAWLASRAGFKLGGVLLTGYIVWGVVAVIMVGVKRLIGV